jgi:hypothetical protein
MIGEYISSVVLEPDSIHLVVDVRMYIFDYMYANYVYVDSILLADDYASQKAGNTSSSVYNEALWEKTGHFTIPLLRNASRSLTELIYTAWTEAGKPSMFATGMDDAQDVSARPSRKGILLEPNYPNPFAHGTTIAFTLSEGSETRLTVLDAQGRMVDELVDHWLEAGEYRIEWSNRRIPAGVYYLVLKAGGESESRVMLRR